MPITWPKNPKIDDVVAVVNALEIRVMALEAYVVRNDTRITALEATYSQIAAERGARIAQLESDNRRISWAVSNGRQDILR